MEQLNTPADRLRWARKQRGLHANHLSLAAGLSAGHVGLIESGIRADPSADTFARLATTLGVSLDWLVLGHGPLPSLTPDASSGAK